MFKFEAWGGGSQNQDKYRSRTHLIRGLRSTSLWSQEEFAGSATGFKVAVRVGSVSERVGVFEAELKSAVGDSAEDGSSAKLEVFTGGDVVPECRPGDIERAEGRESNEVEGRDGSAGTAKEDESSARAENLQ